ncbi:MAG: 1,5-anhydro-D-fructose reductase [Verrucomicrobia bacterium ADurb.Bin118]|nr:MAG: 1,5-anhydro-D-fructose reductase [Verrucomicrobia bacterium ADurb.Bin118]
MKRFKVGIVGYGWAALAHIPAINASPLAQVTAICSARPLDAAALAAQHGGPLRTFTRYEDLLRDPEVDAVSICSYHALHAEQVIAAAKAGKHIICEKPLALSWKDVRAVERAVKKAGVKFCICFELRYSSQFLALKALIDQGLLGTLHYGEVDYYHGVGPWYREFQWCTTIKDCGSSLLEAGCHAMDALLLCLGDAVEEVASYGAKSASPTYAPYEYPPTTVTLLKFRDGKVGKCASVIDCWQPYYFHTHLVGSEGSVLDNKFHSNRINGLSRHHWSQLSCQPVDSGDVADHPYQTQFEAFFEALAQGRDMPLTGLREAVATHEILFAADLALHRGRPVKLAEFRAKR